MGNTHYIPDIRSSRNGMRDNQIRLRLLRRRLKPERQPVLLEPEPVRLLLTEVKEVFISPPNCEFQFVRLKNANSWHGAHWAHMKIARLPFLFDSNTDDVAVPQHVKIRRKSNLYG